jgi:stage II sporulation protein AA (anti-sigma F factor antagonist)
LVEIEKTGEVLVAALKGEIDLRVAPELRERLDRAIEGFAARHLVVDFAGVSFIDSTGLGVILGRYKRVTGTGGKFAVTGLKPAVRRVVELSGLLRIAPEFNSRAQAVRALAGGGAGA